MTPCGPQVLVQGATFHFDQVPHLAYFGLQATSSEALPLHPLGSGEQALDLEKRKKNQDFISFVTQEKTSTVNVMLDHTSRQ